MIRTSLSAGRAAVGALLLTLAGCGGNAAKDHTARPGNPPGPGDQPAVVDSIEQRVAPAERTARLLATLNGYRRSTFQRDEEVLSSNVLYTAAFRHTMYIDSLNSAGWEKVPPPGGNPAEKTTLNPNSKYFEMFPESVVPGSPFASFPALYTNTDHFNRIEAIAGGRKFLSDVGATRSEAYEAAVFNGSVWRADGTISEFRGFNLDTRQVDDPAKYAFDEIENLWYSRRGRAILSRAALRWIGAATVDDGTAYTPPYPILHGRFRGFVEAIASRPLTGQFGFWPNVDNVGAAAVTAYGTDTDLNGPNQFAGPPIHLSLPVAEPIRRDNGVVACDLRRVDAPVTRDPTWRWFAIYSNVDGLKVPIAYSPGSAFAAGEYRARGLPAPIVSDAIVDDITVQGYDGNPPDTWTTLFNLDASVDFSKIAVGDKMTIKIRAGAQAGNHQFTITGIDLNSHGITVSIPSPRWTGADWADDLTNVKVDIFSRTASGVTALVDPQLRDGEFMIVPVAPLEPNARYRVSVHLRTASYDTGLRTWEFETNDKTNSF